MSNDELFRAFGMFQEGVQKYATSAAIGAAADQVNQLNNSTVDEMAKRTELNKVGQSLSLHLSQIGAPVSQIEQAVGAVKPTPFKNANDMYLTGLQTGSKQVQDLAQKQQKFEEDPKAMLAKMQIDRAAMQQRNTLNMLDRKQAQADYMSADKTLTKANEFVSTEMRARSGPLGKAADRLMSAHRLETLFQQADDKGGLDSINSNQATEIAKSVAALVGSGGTSSLEEIKSLTPSSYKGDYKAWLSKLQNEPLGLEQKKFYQSLRDTASREADTARSELASGPLKYLSGLSDYATHPDARVRKKWDTLLKRSRLTQDHLDAYLAGGQTPIEQKMGGSGQAAAAAPSSQPKFLYNNSKGEGVYQMPDGSKKVGR